MTYESISLNNEGSRKFGLVNITKEDFACYEKAIETLDPNFVSQAYEIFNDNIYAATKDHKIYSIQLEKYEGIIGIVYISSVDDQKVSLKLIINNNAIIFKEAIPQLIKALLETLKYIYNDKDIIELEVINNIIPPISEFNYTTQTSNNNTIVTLDNRKTKSNISQLCEDISETKKTFFPEPFDSEIDYKLANDSALRYGFDDDYMDKLENGSITIPELFLKHQAITIKNHRTVITTNQLEKIEEIFNFDRVGRISYTSQLICEDNLKKPVNVISNFTQDQLSLSFDEKNDGEIIASSTPFHSTIKTKQIRVEGYPNRKKTIEYKSPIVQKSSIYVTLIMDTNNKIQKCYIDFRFHRRNNKIRGHYNLRIKDISYGDRLSLYYVGHKQKDSDISHIIERRLPSLYDEITQGEITVEKIDKLIPHLISIFNELQPRGKKLTFANIERPVIGDIMDSYKNTINSIISIELNTPSPHLKKDLYKLIAKHKPTINPGHSLTYHN